MVSHIAYNIIICTNIPSRCQSRADEGWMCVYLIILLPSSPIVTGRQEGTTIYWFFYSEKGVSVSIRPYITRAHTSIIPMGYNDARRGKRALCVCLNVKSKSAKKKQRCHRRRVPTHRRTAPIAKLLRLAACSLITHKT